MDYEKNNRVLARQGQRGTFGMVLHELAKTNDKIYALSADLVRTSGLARFFKDYPERSMNIGIAEQNLISFAAGLADGGDIPFATTFANFAALRANEFVRHFMAYMECNVNLIGLGSGFSMELFGNTHYGLEDLAVLRAMPNLVILSPADAMETGKCIEYCARHTGPVYVRLSGKSNCPCPVVNQSDFELEVGAGRILSDGKDAIIYATGSMVDVALRSASKLKGMGIEVSVVELHTIKPLDEGLIADHKDYPLILSIEEHSITGGLGTAIAEVLAKYQCHGRLLQFGVRDGYKKAGTYDYMLEQNGLTVEHVVSAVCNGLNGK